MGIIFKIVVWTCCMVVVTVTQAAGSSGDISLNDAFGYTITTSAEIQIEKEKLDQLMGSALTTTGQFDTYFLFGLQGGFHVKRLTQREYQIERVKRGILLGLAGITENIADGWRGDPFKLNFDIGGTQVDIDLGSGGYCSREVTDLQDFLRCISEESYHRLGKLGGMPTSTEKYDAQMFLGASKTFRNGIVFTPRITVDIEDKQFRGKPTDPKYGGMGGIDTYHSNLGFDVKVPLGKGWGEESTGAAEKAAWVNHKGGVLNYQHTVAQTTRDVVERYWELAAADEKLQLWEESRTWQQNTLLTTVQQLIEAEELPKAEMNRLLAKDQQIEVSVLEARKEIKNKKIELVETIGLQVEDIRFAPNTGDPLPEFDGSTIFETITEQSMIQHAWQNRKDLQAAKRVVDSSEIQLQAARLDLESKKDLDFSFYYQGYERDSYIARGLENVLYDDLTGPSVTMRFSMDLPFENSYARGDELRAQSTMRKATIRHRNLKRQIRLGVIEARQNLAETREQLRYEKEAADYYRQTKETVLQSFKEKIATLFDVIKTEDQLTDSLLKLAGAKVAYAKAVANLRYEMGLLVYQDNGVFKLHLDPIFNIPALSPELTTQLSSKAKATKRMVQSDPIRVAKQ